MSGSPRDVFGLTARALYAWATVPRSADPSPTMSREWAAVCEREFRWHRASRVPEHCVPWRLGQSVGWRVESPVSVDVEPLGDIELAVPETESERRAMAAALPDRTLWIRGQTTAVATARGDWMRRFDFRHGEGWESMFIANGAGSIEWRLGWALELPADASALLVPDGRGVELGVQWAILHRRSIERQNALCGVGVAMTPTRRVRIERGDVIARLIALPPEVLRARLDAVAHSPP